MTMKQAAKLAARLGSMHMACKYLRPVMPLSGLEGKLGIGVLPG